MNGKLRPGRALSSLLAALGALVILAALALPSRAHEVRPSVADAEVGADSLRLDIQVTLEALVAGIDLNGLQNTNDSPLSGYYDQLRQLPPDRLRAAFDGAWPRIREGIGIQVEDVTIPAEFADLRIPEIGDPGLPRDSVLTLTAALPEGAAPVQVGWSAAFGPLVVRQVATGEGEPYTGYLTGGQLSDPLPRTGVAEVGAVTDFLRYIVLGFEHIMPKGLDHILFVLGLFFFSLRLAPLLVQVTAFTLAHSVTLALATLNIVSVPAQIVEPLIAASIVFVAVENLFETRMSLLRTGVVFCFGLLHGLGFASVLGEIGLSPARLATGLVGFNIGVELGQLAVIAAAWVLLAAPFGKRPWYRARIAVPASLAIAGVGAWWVVERTLL